MLCLIKKEQALRLTNNGLVSGSCSQGVIALYRSNLLDIIFLWIPFSVLSSASFAVNLSRNGHWQTFQRFGGLISMVASSAGVVAVVGVAWIVECAVLGNSTTWKNALRHGLSRLASGVGTIPLAGLIMGGLSLLFIVPGVIWIVYYTFIQYVVALRGMGDKKALDYSKNLVKGRWWRVAGVTFLINFPIFIIQVAIIMPSILWLDRDIVRILLALIGNFLFSLSKVIEIIFFLNLDYRTHHVRLHQKRRVDATLPLSDAGM